MLSVGEAIAGRRSVRAFLGKAVDLDLVASILRQASRAPSGCNLQPWHIHVVSGGKMAELKAIMAQRSREMPSGEGTEYPITPPELPELYRARLFGAAETLYASMGIAREEKARRAEWFFNNFQFFGAPIGLFCYVDRAMGAPQWSDLGMYLQSVMLLLREAGLDSCPQECWAMYPRTVDAFVGSRPEQMLFTGMAIGWKDEHDPVNQCATERVPLEDFAVFHA